MLSTGLYSDLQSLNDSGTPPRERIKDALAVRNMFQTAYRAYDKRHRRNAMVKGLIDGNPPWADKIADGQRYRSNFNNGEAYAYLETAITAFYDVYSEPETYATITVDSVDPEAPVWGEKLTKNFDWLLRQDDAMDYNIQLSIHDMVTYGTGPQVFLRPLDWRSSAVPNKCLYVADDTKANVADWEWCIFQFDYGVNELYDFIADETTAKAAGWDVEAVKQSIMNSKPSSWAGDAQWNFWETWQSALRNNDIYLGSQCAKVRVAKMLYKEFSEDGSPSPITECWVDLDASDDKFLCHKRGLYDDMRQAVCAFYYDRGDGSHQSIKGLGVKMFSLLTTRMRLQLTAVDAAFASSSVFLQSNQPAGRSTMGNIQVGAFTVLPQGLSIQQANLQGVLEPALAMSSDMGRTLDNNLSQYRQKMELPEGNPPTKYQVQAQLAQSATLGKTQLSRYYQQLDELYAEKFRRASNRALPKTTKNKWLKYAIEFQQRCRDDGVPNEAFEKVRVRATRIAGQGSPFLREQGLNQLYATLYPALPEDGKERLVRDMISATVGPNLTSRYWTVEQDTPRKADQEWQAQMENDAFYDGSDLIRITPQQNDSIHLNVHFPFLLNGLMSLQQGGNPEEVYNTLVAGRQHVTQHLIRLSQNPMRKNEFDQFKQLFDQLNGGIGQLEGLLRQQAQQQAEAQQAQAEAMSDMDADMIRAQAKMQIDQAKAANQIELKNAKAQQDMQLKQAKTAQDLRIKQMQTAQQVSQEAIRFQQEVNRQAIENAGLIAKQRIENEKPTVQV